jgi:hypothetical protein
MEVTRATRNCHVRRQLLPLVLLSATLFLMNFWCCSALISSSTTSSNNDKTIQKLDAAVLVPGFLTGADEFKPMCEELTRQGLPTIAVPMPNWHWIPCLGGRSARPILERIDFTVKHVIANDGDITKIPNYSYTLQDLWTDFKTNPGGIFQVGGSSRVDEYAVVQPQGTFPLPNEQLLEGKKVALIGHSAGGWISRVYLSDQNYGGRIYGGSKYVHSLVTLGTPHVSALNAAFEGVAWLNNHPENITVPSLAVGGAGFMGSDWGPLTLSAYAFCCPDGSTGESYDGDGLTPLFSSIGMKGAEQMVIDGAAHFCWSDVFGGALVAPKLAKDYSDKGLWYGSPQIVEQWLGWIKDQIRR